MLKSRSQKNSIQEESLQLKNESRVVGLGKFLVTALFGIIRKQQMTIINRKVAKSVNDLTEMKFYSELHFALIIVTQTSANSKLSQNEIRAGPWCLIRKV